MNLNKSPKSSPSYHLKSISRAAIIALGLAGIAKTTDASAQVLSPEQDAEYRRLFNLGSTAYQQDDFTTALRNFVAADRINPNIEMSWNIIMVEIRASGFRVFTSEPREAPETATRRHREVNNYNNRRLEEVLGFTTLPQLQSVRENLQDALNRTRSRLVYYPRRVQELNALPASQEREGMLRSARTEITQANEILPFLENSLERINHRYTELQPRQNTPVVIVQNQLPSQGQLPTVQTQQRPTVTLETPAVRQPTTTYHTERPWGVGIGIGVGGLTTMGISAVSYFATNPQNAGDDRTITTLSNALFWVGTAVTAASPIVIVAGGRRVADQPRRVTILPTFQAQPGNVSVGVAGSF